MNRTIKFRAWDGKQMHYSYIIAGAEYCNVLTILQDEEFAKKYYKVDEWKVMQFTGLLDCEGKEIYEGDILVRSKNKNSPFKAIVEWGWGGFRGVTVPYRNHSIPLSEIQTMQGAEYDIVVGNIYEHPNLLNNES